MTNAGVVAVTPLRSSGAKRSRDDCDNHLDQGKWKKVLTVEEKFRTMSELLTQRTSQVKELEWKLFDSEDEMQDLKQTAVDAVAEKNWSDQRLIESEQQSQYLWNESQKKAKSLKL